MLDIRGFLDSPEQKTGAIRNERALQLELGCYLRDQGFRIEFERAFTVDSLTGSTRKPKRDLDLLVSENDGTTAIELKVPLAGRVPETMYDFCADIEFVEGLVRLKLVDRGFCLLVTNNRQFWTGSQSGIYDFFRTKNAFLTGCISKPTGARDSTVLITGRYCLGAIWSELGNNRLMESGRYLLVEVENASS